ncbi:MAG: sulfatase [Bryobacteraceae bacterium]
MSSSGTKVPRCLKSALQILLLCTTQLAAQVYRLDDHLIDASITAPQTSQSAQLAPPLEWKRFTEDTEWQSVRGRLGIRNGELIAKGAGSSPVILAPQKLSIDWSRYEAVRIRMMAQGGSEIKIKIGDYELKDKLAPRGEYQVYEFQVGLAKPTYGRPLAIMPTDSIDQLVSIGSIEIVPRRLRFAGGSGRQNAGKQEEYRNTVYAAAPSSISFPVKVPAGGARMSFGMGIVDQPVAFRVAVAGTAAPLFSRTVSDARAWAEAEADLAAYAGRTIRLTLSTESTARGAVGLWANPLIVPAQRATRPNILVYMVDTLRASHTSLHGYQRTTTPFLSKLAASGTVFDDCHAQATWTKPSVASLMTSLYTYAHGINMDTDTIPARAETLAQQLRGAGYVTASAVANPFAGRVTGLERGFDYLMEYPVIDRFRTDAADRGTDSAAINRAVFPWLERHRAEPFFLYLHATDPHAPYRPPAEFERKYANPADTPAFNREYGIMRDRRQYGGGAVVGRQEFTAKGVNADAWIRRAIDRYDAEVEHNDRSFELLIDKLRQLRILDDTLVVFVSDHGEEFLDHGWTGHGHSLYEELTHVIWALWNPKWIPQGKRIKEPVQLIDVMPTLLDLAGVPAGGILQGVSVAPLLKGQPFRRQQPVMSSRFRYPNVRSTGAVPENLTGTVARIDSKWRLVYRDQAQLAGLPMVELFDRTADPGDRRNVAAQHADVVEKQMAEVRQWLDAQAKIRQYLGSTGQTTMDSQTLERLRSLGYIGGKRN